MKIQSCLVPSVDDTRISQFLACGVIEVAGVQWEQMLEKEQYERDVLGALGQYSVQV